jgi:uncharacterized protein (DUF58 family)
VPAGRQTFPFLPRHRHVVGLPFGGIAGRRLGVGTDVIGSRPYQPGDPVSSIDWYASARISAAVGRDEFVVRSRAADEAPRVVVVADRRPGMGIYDPSLPWLSKPAALAEATAVIAASAAAANSEIGSLDFGSGEPEWLPPSTRDVAGLVVDRQRGAPFGAPALERAFAFLGARRTQLPPGSFVFVLSDFLDGPADEVWLTASAYGWDLIPIVIQDPVWEQSFPQVGSVVVPVRDAASTSVLPLRLTRREAAARRDANERRLADLQRSFGSLDLDWVMLVTSDPEAVDRAFGEWAEERRRWRRAG